MSRVIIAGHKNPDNDAVSSAVALAYLKNQIAARKKEADPEAEVDEFVPVALGPLPAETAWNLDECGIPQPEIIDHVEPGQPMILVDHNESKQAVDGLAEANVIEVVDHHRIGDFTTASPLYYTARPWGSTATIVTTQFKRADVEITPAMARVLLSAILTDTVILKSPTTTPHDVRQVELLAPIAGVDPVEFGQQLFKCRGGEADLPIEKFVEGDAKEFEVAGKTVLISQHETVDLKGAMDREDEARAYMKKLLDEKGYGFVLLFVTDILKEGSNFVVEGDHATIDRVFGIDSSKTVWMDGIMSRKKQVAAPLLQA